MRWLLPVVLFIALAGWAAGVVNPAAGEVRFAPAGVDAMHEVYTRTTERGQPIFITSDSVLHTAHLLFDYTLRAAEVKHFDATLRTLNTRMLAQVQRDGFANTPPIQYLDPTAPPRTRAYERAAAYFEVAKLLLDPDAPMPKFDGGYWSREIDLINAASSVTISPTLGVTEDYTQYKPRGHYTRSETLKRYFRAMMWFGRAGFAISGEKAPGVPLTVEEKRENALAGLVLATALAKAKWQVADGTTQTAQALWQSLFAPTEYLIGHSDDLTPGEFAILGAQCFPTGLPMTWKKEAQAAMDDFIARALKLRAPKILGGVQSDERADPPVALRFMGQRFIPDSYYFSQLTHAKVRDRYMPTGLDVMAVLGSPRAKWHLEQRGDPQKYPDYLKRRDALQQEMGTWLEVDWKMSAYRLWLQTLQRIAADPSLRTTQGYANLPPWWTSPRWQDKQLNAALGSWAELRHDTILYAKQSYTMVATSVFPMARPEPLVYVEPVMGVYSGIAGMLANLRQELTKHGVFPDEMKRNYDDFGMLLQTLAITAWHEARPMSVDGLPRGLTEDDWTRLRGIGALLKSIETLSPELAATLTNGEDSKVALVADVHTDPNKRQVLEVAVGQVMTVSVPIADGNGVGWATGPIFSYTEFTYPMDKRLTDAEWQKMLEKGTAPPPLLLGAAEKPARTSTPPPPIEPVARDK
jgi:hypothetical protein